MAEEKKPLPDVDDEVRRAITAARSGDAQPSLDPQAAPRRALTTRQKIGVAAVGALSVVLIAVSATFLFPVAEPESGVEATPQPVVAPADEAVAAGEIEGQEQEQEVAEDDASDDAVATQETPPASGDAVPSVQDGAQQSPATSGPSSEPPRSVSTITVTVGVSSSAVGNPVSGGTTVTFEEGATAYDALMACGLSVNASSSQFGVYVSAIGGLAEKEHGGSSGWKYAVNGVDPSTACSNYILHDGDQVQWRYVLDANG